MAGITKKPNLALAILMAILFGLVGCGLYGLLYYLDIIAWISALLLVVGAGLGYQLFYHKIDTKGWIIILVIAFVEITLTLFICVDITVINTLAEEGTQVSFFGGFEYMFDLMARYASVKSAFIRDLLLSYGMVLAGFLVDFVTVKRRQRDDAFVTSPAKVSDPIETTEQSAEVKNAEETPAKKKKVCPNCGAEMEREEDLYVCKTCGKKFRIKKKS